MIVRELNALISEANYLLVLTPIVIYVYLYSLVDSLLILSLAILACLICAFFLNFTRGHPEIDDEDSDSEEVSNYATGAFILSLVSWAILWGYSVYRIFEYIGSSDMSANVLFFGSIAWAAMLVTHFGLDYWLNDYTNEMYEFVE